MKPRDLYLKRLLSFRGTDLVKVVTGIRRCGKSSLLKLMIEQLRTEGVEEERIITMNFESMEYSSMSNRELYQYVKERISPKGKTYLFFDEVQRIIGWQDAVNSFRVDFDCDIYVTGSNAFLLSSELSTYLSGRYVEIRMLPLSFQEFLSFHGYTIALKRGPDGRPRRRVLDCDGESYDPKELFDVYVKFGGMPALADIGLEQEKATMLLDGIYSAVVVRDILERGRRREQRAITDPILLRKVIMFLADNIGNITSTSSIGRTLVDEGLLDEGPRKVRPASQTIETYIRALTEAFIFYPIKRFDIKGKEYLRTLNKYYIVDTGLRSYLLGYRDGDTGHLLENVIYFELLRRGYEVAIGKVGTKEVDFVATKTDEKKYIQVTDNMNGSETRARELAPLQAIQDNYEKMIIAMDCDLTQDQDGIKIVRAMDFLMEEY